MLSPEQWFEVFCRPQILHHPRQPVNFFIYI